MEKKLKLIFILMLVPASVNGVISLYLLSSGGLSPEFGGYGLGTLLCLILSFSWLWQIKRVMNASPIAMLKAVAVGFFLKLLLVLAFLLVGRYLADISLPYFAIAFGSGLIVSLIAEIIIYMAASKRIKTSG